MKPVKKKRSRGTVNILGLGWSLPDTVLTNDFLHKKVGLEKDPDWVASRLGIKTRYTVLTEEYILQTKNKDPNQAILHARAHQNTPEGLGVKAARMALSQAGVTPDKIGWVLANCDIPFFSVPNIASLIARELGVGPGPHCDLNTACTSFGRHMQLIADMREERVPEFVLCVQTNAYTTRTDYSSKSIDGYLWGDGAAAQVVSVKHPGRIIVEPLIAGTHVADAEEVIVDTPGHFSQNGAKIREFSIRKTCEMFEAIAAEKGLYAESTYTVAHQANYVMQDSIIGHLHLPPGKHLRNVQDQGNIAGPGCPSVIAQQFDKLHKGDQLIYAVLGAGLAWGGGYMEIQ